MRNYPNIYLTGNCCQLLTVGNFTFSIYLVKFSFACLCTKYIHRDFQSDNSPKVTQKYSQLSTPKFYVVTYF